MGFKERFQALVKARGTTQEAIASLLGVNRVTISKWMAKGIIPRADQAEKIARFLGVSVEYLVAGTSPIASPAGSAGDSESRELLDTWINEHREIVLDLMVLDQPDLALVRPMIAAAASEARRRKSKL